MGVVDGTYVRCPKEKSPSGGPDVTYSGKHRVHCRTALIVVNSAGRLLDATGAWPGSYHDTRVFKEEEVHMKF